MVLEDQDLDHPDQVEACSEDHQELLQHQEQPQELHQVQPQHHHKVDYSEAVASVELWLQVLLWEYEAELLMQLLTQ